MENLINKITNEELDSIALKNGKPKNSLNIEIPFSYALELMDINWNDILFAIENGYFNNDSAIEYATILLGSDEDDEKILDLAILNSSDVTKEELLQNFVVELANKVSEKEKEDSKDKIMYLLLSLLFKNKDDFVDPFFVVEYVYDDFDSPKSIANFVRYMLIDDDCNSISTAKKIYNNWYDYLCSQKLKFGST